MSPFFIRDFHIRRPPISGSHAESVEWLAAAHTQSEGHINPENFDPVAFHHSMKRFITRFGCSAENMAFRGFEIDDFLSQDWDRMRVFNLNADVRGASMDIRMEVFSETSEKVLAGFYADVEEPPLDIVHVSCTGYVAPSAPQKLVLNRSWEKQTGVMHAYHMGCYASMPALRIATGLLETQTKTHSKQVDIVHTEMCSLHLNPSLHSPEQLVVQSLFGDGHIKYSVTKSTNESKDGFLWMGTREELIPGSLGTMAWSLGSNGMRMMLARDVPERISAALGDFLKRLYADVKVDEKEAFTQGIFAIHPGGPRIIDKIAALLNLTAPQVAASRAALKAYGNMSSATLPHVWAAILKDESVVPGTLITSLAFGPGLTMYGTLLRKI